MDNKLRTTIDNIIRLSKQNPEFNAEMRKYFGGSDVGHVNANDDAAINKIEHYLGLDVYIDRMDASIDYSYIKERTVRDQLECDNREMMRFRYGTRYHKIIFPEFCRYAQLQGEMLLNYFYTTIEAGNITKIKKHITDYNSKAKFGNETNEVFKISFNVKKWAFANEFSLSSNYVWNNIIQVRNLVSHGSPIAVDERFIKEYFEKIKNQGYIIKADGSLANWNKLDKDHRNYYNKNIRNTEDNKKYTFEVWLSEEPFETVTDAVKEMNEKIMHQLYIKK